MKSVFASHGIPQEVQSDNGTQFSSALFHKSSTEYKFTYVTSSPLYPASNGEAERAFRTVKIFLKECDDPYLALLAYRLTPLYNGYSPAELLMGWQLRTILPILPEHLLFLTTLRYYKERLIRGKNRRATLTHVIPQGPCCFVFRG